MQTFRKLLVMSCFVGLLGTVANGVEFEWLPVTATGSHTLNGNEIILDGGGQTVMLHYKISGWDGGVHPGDPDYYLGQYQATVNATAYLGANASPPNPGVDLIPVGQPNNGFEGAFMALKVCTAAPYGCVSGEQDLLSVCANQGDCDTGELCLDRCDHVYYQLGSTCSVSTATIDYSWSCASTDCKEDTDGTTQYYAGTLLLEVPAGAVGTYTVSFYDDPNFTLAATCPGPLFDILNITPVLITILCSTNQDCDDGNACTNNVCDGNGVCQSTLTYNPAVDCCNPATGGTTTINDGDECTDDICNTDGSVKHPPLDGAPCGGPPATCYIQSTCDGQAQCIPNLAPPGAPCGDPPATCYIQSTCDGQGQCIPNLAPPGTACGGPPIGGCDAQDECDAQGTCEPLVQPEDTPCGDQTDTQCDDPNTCDAGGVCLTNQAPTGSPCEAGNFCESGDFCSSRGQCREGSDWPCDDGIGCTDDLCDEDNDVCTNAPNDAHCVDALWCNGTEYCDTALDCQSVSPPDCNDDVDCTNDSCNETTDSCDNIANDAKCDNGDWCDGAEICDGTACVLEPGSVPNCDDGVGCTNDSCNDTTDSCDNIADDANCDDGSYCNGAETCDANDDCQPGTPVDCDDGNECTEDYCDEDGQTCVNNPWPNGTACGDPTDTDCDNPDTCDGNGTCLSNLELPGTGCGDPSDTDCDNPDTCDGVGTCDANNEPDGPAGAGLCDDANQCTQDNCLAGACDNPNEPDGSGCDDGLYCTLTDTCSNGLCTGAGNPCAGPDGDANCAETCDEGNDNCLGNDPDGSTCAGNGVGDCTAADTCLAGICEDNDSPNGPAGPGLCDDGNDCTDDVCGAGSCANPAEPSGTACGVPTDTGCDNPDTCDGNGTCQSNLEPPGTACGDPSDTDCDNPDTCDGAGTCEGNNEPDGPAGPGLCDDANQCTQDNCLAGACSNPNEPDGSSCDDGLFCTLTDECDSGLCVGAGDPCAGPDGDANCAETCDETFDDCLANDPDGSACAGNGVGDCTAADTCLAGFCEDNDSPNGPAGPGLCDDGNECTDDVCDTGSCANPAEQDGFPCGDPTDNECDHPDTCDGTGTCVSNLEPPGTACGDPSDTDCDNPDTCSGAGTCEGNNEPDGPAGAGLCDDANQCTQDNCLTGACSNPNEPDGTGCDDGLFCTATDTCTNGLCTGAGNPCDGADGDADCAETCDENAGDCLANDPDGSACAGNGVGDCTAPDTCLAGVCEDNDSPNGPADPGLCDDGNDCTDDVCSTGNCTNPAEPGGTACGDGDDTECTDPDTCDGTGFCDPHHEPSGTSCGDFTDTDCDNPDSCDGSGACLDNLEPDGTTCDDGLFCNVDEECTAGACGGGSGNECSDGVGCTDDSCDEVNDVCVNAVNDAACNNGQWCDGVEICDAAQDCVVEAGSVPDCADTVPCTDDTCDEDNDVCVNTANDANCDDGLWCTGTETCDSVNDCQPGTPPCTGPMCDEENQSCVNPVEAATGIHGTGKHRYLSINPNTNGAVQAALRVDLVQMKRCSGLPERACTFDDDCEATLPGSGTCVQHADVGSAGPWWVQAPQQEQLGCIPGPCGDEDWFARVGAVAHFQVWTLSTLHIGDCEVIPVVTYEIRACMPPDGLVCSDPLTIGTIGQPFIAPGFRGNFGDVAGPVIGTDYTPPDGFTSVVDISAYVFTKQNYGTSNAPQTHPTWVDLHGNGAGNPPQYIISVSDLGMIKNAMVGDTWTDDPGNMNPGECP